MQETTTPKEEINEGKTKTHHQLDEEEKMHQKYELEAKIQPTEYLKYEDEEELKVDVSGKLVEDEIPNQFRTLIWSLAKQVRPGMDLSRVTLPTFILEPRSMLEKMTDFLTHIELVEQIPLLQSPLERMIQVVKWYLSGLYIRPKGVKKGYNPILGEIFRCRWNHTDSSKTHLVAEQVSHHPPVSAFYASNRKKGYVFNGSIYFRSTFTGASVGSILDGRITCFLLPQQEEYSMTLPAAYATGFLMGTLIMELGGEVRIDCAKTGYHALIDFKRKPWIGGDYNVIGGHIDHDGDLLYYINGKWDGKIEISSAKNSDDHKILWKPSGELFNNRIRKEKPKEMKVNESGYLWRKVTKAIRENDQDTATEEKTRIEEEQRANVRMRKEQGIEYHTKLFDQIEDDVRYWKYKHYNTAPYDPEKEDGEIEEDGIIHIIKKK